MLLLLLLLLVVLIVLGYRHHSRLSRNEANLRILRDRANMDLQMTSQIQIRVHVQTQSDDSASLPDSLRSISLRKAPAASLPPGPTIYV